MYLILCLSNLFFCRENGIKNNLQQTTQQNGNKSIGGSSKHVAFAANGLPPHLPSSPDVRECMNEMQFNKVLTKKKNKVRVECLSKDHNNTVIGFFI